MSLANCSRCGRVFSMVPGGRDACPSCVKEEDENFKKVFHYFSTCPAATAQEISQATEVDIKEIYRYVRENRLRLVKTDTGLQCERCEIPISQGKMCENCMRELTKEIKTDIDKFKNQKKMSLPPKKADSDPKHLKERRGKGN